MRTRDINYLNMALAVKRIMKAHEGEIGTRKMLQQKVGQMNDTITAMQQHLAEAEMSSEGATASKQDVAAAAIDLALQLAGSAVEYAREKKDMVRKEQFSLSKGDFNGVDGVTAVARLRELIKNLREEADGLGDWDVTQDDTDRLEGLTAQLNDQLADPRGAIAFRKSHNEKAYEALGKLKEIMESIDNLMIAFKGTKFMNEYEAARMVIDLGSRKEKDDGGNEGQQAGGAEA